MAVHTKLTKEEISNFVKENYQIGELISFKEIIDGIDNSNFIIETDKDKFILTLFESRIVPEELPFFMNLKLHLARHQICCPKPVRNNSDDLISTIKNKSASIVSFLSGSNLKPEENGLFKSINKNHCVQIGKVTAQLHNAVNDFEGERGNDLGMAAWQSFFDQISDLTEKYQKGLKSEIQEYIDFLAKNWNDNLPKGVVHIDLFPDNVFFDEKDKLSGVIDFYFAANDLLIYDLGVVVNAWCFDELNNFNEEKYQSLLLGYQKIRKISEPELEFLKIALIGASLRFLLTRLSDLFFTPKESLVKVKDPKEYLEKVRFFASKS
ncbi:MAG: homoserine kinase type II [Lentimonas sp.]|jgi:homoserine kinase type II